MKGSRFIATAVPASGEPEVRTAIDAARAEFPDATHHAWAMSLQGTGHDPGERWHDAGEPRGTAGMPILRAIRGAGLANVAIVVTRYFGGTKLGKGGLARAYHDAAARALEDAPRLTAVPVRLLLVSVPLRLDSEARHLVARLGGRVESSIVEGAERSVMRASVPAGAETRLRDALQRLARGSAILREIDRGSI